MKIVTQSCSGTNSGDPSLLAARILLRDTYCIVSGIQHIAAFLLRYATLGTAIADGLANAAYPVLDEN